MSQTVASQSSAVSKMAEAWELCEALMGGTAEMRSEGKKYLPQWPAEDNNAYKARVATAVLFPAFSRTVDTLAGKPFSKPLTLSEDMPDEVRTWCSDIDREGRNLQSFAADCMTAALSYGLGGILVEYPDASTVPTNAAGVRTMEAERLAGLRPYFVHIEAEQILGWRVKKGQILMLRLMERVEEEDGEFGTKEVDQVRVLTPGAWRTYRIPADKQEWKDAVIHQEGVTTLEFVPFVPYYGKRTGFMTARPPLLEVAHLNVAHWQSASDQQTILHAARVPILFLKNLGDAVDETGKKKEVVIGASSAIHGNNTDSDAYFVEHTGAAIGAGRTDLQDLEERMRQAGAELLVIKPGQVTATQTSVENAVGMSALQRITLDLQDALNLALQYLGKWVRIENAGTVALFNDFGVASLAEASAELLLKANTAGKISDETFREELRRRSVLSGAVDEVTEVSRIEAEGPTGLPDPTGGNGGGA